MQLIFNMIRFSWPTRREKGVFEIPKKMKRWRDCSSWSLKDRPKMILNFTLKSVQNFWNWVSQHILTFSSKQTFGNVEYIKVLQKNSGSVQLAYVKFSSAYHAAMALENCDESNRFYSLIRLTDTKFLCKVCFEITRPSLPKPRGTQRGHEMKATEGRRTPPTERDSGRTTKVRVIEMLKAEVS